jgi:hypothetical protein
MKIFESQHLIGSWISEPEENEASEKIRIDFFPDGKLTYTTIYPDKEQKIFLTYRVSNGVLITDQPSHPREEKTPFSFTPDGKLALVYGEEVWTFKRYSLVTFKLIFY